MKETGYGRRESENIDRQAALLLCAQFRFWVHLRKHVRLIRQPVSNVGRLFGAGDAPDQRTGRGLPKSNTLRGAERFNAVEMARNVAALQYQQANEHFLA